MRERKKERRCTCWVTLLARVDTRSVGARNPPPSVYQLHALSSTGLFITSSNCDTVSAPSASAVSRVWRDVRWFHKWSLCFCFILRCHWSPSSTIVILLKSPGWDLIDIPWDWKYLIYAFFFTRFIKWKWFRKVIWCWNNESICVKDPSGHISGIKAIQQDCQSLSSLFPECFFLSCPFTACCRFELLAPALCIS